MNNDLVIKKYKQTPKLEPMENPKQFIEDNTLVLCEFALFLRTLPEEAVGVAANQLGLKDRFVAIKRAAMFWEIIIDPKIEKMSMLKVDKIEGCLSWPNYRFRVRRANTVRVTYYDTKGNFHKEKVSGFEAQIWQHEIDHLNGVVMDDRV